MTDKATDPVVDFLSDSMINLFNNTFVRWRQRPLKIIPAVTSHIDLKTQDFALSFGFDMAATFWERYASYHKNTNDVYTGCRINSSSHWDLFRPMWKNIVRDICLEDLEIKSAYKYLNHYIYINSIRNTLLTFWRRNFFFNFSTPCV